MRRHGNLLLLILCLTVSPTFAAQANAPVDELREATQAMNEWLGAGATADAWRRFLRRRIAGPRPAGG